MMTPDRFRDFCLNEEARLRRFARTVGEAGDAAKARDLQDLADLLLVLAHEGLTGRPAQWSSRAREGSI